MSVHQARVFSGAKFSSSAIRARSGRDASFIFRIYVIELTASTGKHGEIMDPAISTPHEALAHWQSGKSH
jgi:hypothetical protein